MDIDPSVAIVLAALAELRWAVARQGLRIARLERAPSRPAAPRKIAPKIIAAGWILAFAMVCGSLYGCARLPDFPAAVPATPSTTWPPAGVPPPAVSPGARPLALAMSWTAAVSGMAMAACIVAAAVLRSGWWIGTAVGCAGAAGACLALDRSLPWLPWLFLGSGAAVAVLLAWRYIWPVIKRIPIPRIPNVRR